MAATKVRTVYLSDLQEFNYLAKKSQPHVLTLPNRQDTDVSKHLTDNPDHKIDFDLTEVMI